ncbi:MAG: CapA family protein [Candidatus Limnocylindrales bacterium]
MIGTERLRRLGVANSLPVRGILVVTVLAMLAGCVSGPTAAPSSGVAPTSPPSTVSPTPTVLPSPTAVAIEFPLAVVTGLTNLKGTISLDELAALADQNKLLMPCGVDILAPNLKRTDACVDAGKIQAALKGNQRQVALLPPGLVETETKVLPIAGDGPYGLFGPDLFGDPESRALPYPVQGRESVAATLDPAWTAYDASKVWNMTSIGSLCADRWAAHQAVTLGKGWDWVFGGGTAKYKGKPILNPNKPPGVSLELVVRPVDTGNAGATPAILKRSDIAIADHECPIMPNNKWSPNDSGSALVFAVPEAEVDSWEKMLGLDAVYLAANHMSDRGVAGIRSTIKILDEHKMPHTGLGLNLDEGLEPAYLEVAGIKIGIVAWNDVGGVARADADTAGVPWITKANVDEAVKRARAGGADLVICSPQWWGGREYHDGLLKTQVTQLTWFDGAGCDHVIGAGTHVAGPLLLRDRGDDVSLVLASPGNYAFGQDWWQQTQEGVILDQTFVGTRMVNVRLHPYVMILAARPSLLDPEGDGHYVLERIWQGKDSPYYEP